MVLPNPEAYQVQSIIFKKNLYTLTAAINIAIQHGYKVYNFPMRETKHYYRFRLVNPNYKKYHYVTKNVADGIDLIIGYKNNNR